MVATVRNTFRVAHTTAWSMVGRHGVEAAFVIQREVDAKIRQGDIDGALKSDQIRRELLHLIVDMAPPASY